MWSFERNKIRKMLRKIEMIDLIKIEIVTSKKMAYIWHSCARVRVVEDYL